MYVIGDMDRPNSNPKRVLVIVSHLILCAHSRLVNG
jgi:hypothetical protein